MFFDSIYSAEVAPLEFLIMAVTAVLFYFSRKVTFSGDFTKINYMAPAQSQLLEDLSSYGSAKDAVAVYSVSEGKTLDEALEASEKGRSFAESSLEKGITFTLYVPVRRVLFLEWLNLLQSNPEAGIPYKDEILTESGKLGPYFKDGDVLRFPA